MTANQPLPAHSWAEVNYYLMVTPCPACGKGPWQAEPLEPASPGQPAVRATCQDCGQEQQFEFTAQPPASTENAESAGRLINASAAASRIIDLGQWLSLFYLFLDSAHRQTDRAAGRRLGYQAAQCLAEALKFYGEDELPPPGAFFTDSSREAFREHPEKFARQRLRDMLAKLPPLPRMAQRVTQDQRRMVRPRKWWQFWRKRDAIS